MKRLLTIFIISLASLPLISAAQDSQPRVQGSRMSDRLTPDPAFQLDLFAGRLGQITDIEITSDGTIYTLDARSGRVFELRDRGVDGRLDTRRPLPHRFDNPTAMAVVEGRIFIADRLAVWELINGISARKIAALDKIKAGEQKFLIAGETPDHLILGLNTGSTAKLIQIDISTGRATQRAETSGQLTALSRLPGGAVWTVLKTIEGAQLGLSLKNLGAPIDAKLTAITAIDQALLQEANLGNLGDALLAIENDVSLKAYPMTFGQIKQPARTLLEGFRVKQRAAPWGQIRALSSDTRGIFIADGINGDLWRLSPKPTPPHLDPAPSPASSGDIAPDL